MAICSTGSVTSRVKEDGGQIVEGLHAVADIPAAGAALSQVGAQIVLAQIAGQFLGHLGAGVQQSDARPHIGADHVGEQGIVGAPQDQSVHPGGSDGGEIFRCDGLDDHIAGPGAAILHQRHEQRAGAGGQRHIRVFRPDHPVIGPGADGGGGGDNADPSVFCHLRRSLGGGEHHAEDGQVGLGPQVVQRDGGHGAAGDDNGLQVKAAQEVDILHGIATDDLPGAGAVGHPSGVAEVDDVFVGQQCRQTAHGGQAAEAGIKHADRAVIHEITSSVRQRSGRYHLCKSRYTLIYHDSTTRRTSKSFHAFCYPLSPPARLTFRQNRL